MDIMGRRITSDVSAFIEAHKLEFTVKYELLHQVGERGQGGTAGFKDDIHTIKVVDYPSTKFFSQLLAHEYCHCIQREKGYSIVRSHQAPTDMKLAELFWTVIGDIRSAPLDLNANAYLQQNGVDITDIVELSFRDISDKCANKLRYVHSDFITWSFGIGFVVQYLQVSRSRQKNLMENVQRNARPNLKQSISSVLEIANSCGYDSVSACAYFQGSLLSLFGLWDVADIWIGANSISSYEILGEFFASSMRS